MISSEPRHQGVVPERPVQHLLARVSAPIDGEIVDLAQVTLEVDDAGENAGLIEDGFELGVCGRKIAHQGRLPRTERLEIRDVPIDLENEVVADQLHPAVDGDVMAVHTGVAQLARPVSIGEQLRTQGRKIGWKFSFQQRVADAADRLVPTKSVKSLGSRIPEFDSPIQVPHEHGLIGHHQQIGQAFCRFESFSLLRELEFHCLRTPRGRRARDKVACVPQAYSTLNGEREPSASREGGPRSGLLRHSYALSNRKSRTSDESTAFPRGRGTRSLRDRRSFQKRSRFRRRSPRNDIRVTTGRPGWRNHRGRAAADRGNGNARVHSCRRADDALRPRQPVTEYPHFLWSLPVWPATPHVDIPASGAVLEAQATGTARTRSYAREIRCSRR